MKNGKKFFAINLQCGILVALFFAACIPFEGSIDEVREKAEGGAGKTPATYTVTFDKNGATSGTNPEPQTVNAGSSIILPSGAGLGRGPTEIFGGWNTESNGTGANYDGNASYTPTVDITLYAKWNLPPLTGTVHITGEKWINAVLTANTGLLEGNGIITYQWKRGVNEIIGATGVTYTVTDINQIQEISVVVSRAGYSGSKSSGTHEIPNTIGIKDQAALAGILSNRNYILANNITISNNSWTPISGGSTGFVGILNGNGKTINLGIQVYNTEGGYGLFANIGSGGEARDFKMTGSISFSTANGGGTAGAVAAISKGTVKNVASSVSISDLTISSSGTTMPTFGGIVGNLQKGGIVQNCYSTGLITAKSAWGSAGGIVGAQVHGDASTVSFCWSSGYILGDYNGGGIAGSNGSSNMIANCVALQSSIEEGFHTGRIIGYSAGSSLFDNWANGSMLIGSNTVADGGINGQAVTAAQYQTSRTWWNNTAGWTTAINWGENNANTNLPWKWGSLEGGRPVLWFE